jgi:uncharacterized protein YjcR
MRGGEMPKPRDPNRDKAFEIYKEHSGNIDLVEIASQLNISSGTVRGWKSKDKWDDKLNGTLQTDMERSKRHKGGQPGNSNAIGHGAPEKNKNAETHGLFTKYLPEETLSIIQEMPKDPLDVLWDQIQIAYAAIIRSQKIMYVRDINDKTSEWVGESIDVQQAWDKQANFLSAQARAQKTLESMINRYDDLLHKNWEQASEEQRLRIAVLKGKLTIDEEEVQNDGFLDALKGMVNDIWEE